MDKLLNLSAFGEIIGKTNNMEPDNTKSPNKNIVPTEESKYGHIFKMILQNSAQTKLLHWQCALYGQHKALDKLFGNIIKIGDDLAESIMGKYGKPVLTEDQLCLKLMNFENPKDGDLSQFMDHLYKCYAIDCKSLLDENSDSELINILDEMIAAIDQAKYLISLR